MIDLTETTKLPEQMYLSERDKPLVAVTELNAMPGGMVRDVVLILTGALSSIIGFYLGNRVAISAAKVSKEESKEPVESEPPPRPTSALPPRPTSPSTSKEPGDGSAPPPRPTKETR